MVVDVPAAEGLVVSDCVIEVANETLVAPRTSRAKRARLIELRKAIARGEYQVSAADLADALLHAARSAN